MQHITRKPWKVAAALITAAMIFAALVVFQSAAASRQHQEPIPLQPPFTFQTGGVSSLDAPSILPVDATRLLTETFDSSFAPTFGVTGTTTAWRIFTDTQSVNYYWNRVIPLLSGPFQNSAWASCGTCDGGAGGLDPDMDNYPANSGTWMIYGPVNLSDYYGAETSFRFRLDANPAVDGSGYGDFFAAGVSDDGQHFTGLQLTGDQTGLGWQTATLNLGDYAGKPSVYLGFYFRSNGDGQTAQGVFVDDVSLRAAEFLKRYIPVVARNFSVATPIPPFLYNYTFDSGQGENDPDFVVWGQSYSYKPSGATIPYYEQGLAGGHPGTGMYLYTTRKNSESDYIVLAGPNVSVSGNYEISAEFNVFKGKNNSRYGIIFGAGGSTFGRGSGNRPTFEVNSNYYKFALQFPGGSGNDPADFQLERCDGNGYNCIDLVGRTTIPSGASADGVWDNITVRRTGSSIVVRVNNFQILSISDSTYTGSRKFGVFIQAADVNGTDNPLEIDWDNYRVSQLP